MVDVGGCVRGGVRDGCEERWCVRDGCVRDGR